jgi:hypothetical protein
MAGSVGRLLGHILEDCLCSKWVARVAELELDATKTAQSRDTNEDYFNIECYPEGRELSMS